MTMVARETAAICCGVNQPTREPNAHQLRLYFSLTRESQRVRAFSQSQLVVYYVNVLPWDAVDGRL
ncbi:MAG: hypothetical protein ACYDC8_16745 [Gammaproteobacteria bacterium]